MAKKIQKFFSWMTAFALIAVQLPVFAAATESADIEQDVVITVDVATSLPETPGSESQIPSEAENTVIVTSDPITITIENPISGTTEQTATTSTTWYEAEENTFTSGTETTSTVIGSDHHTGDILFEGGTTSGEEISVTEQADTESEVIHNYVTDEITTEVKSEKHTHEHTDSITKREETLNSGTWEDTGAIQEGDFIVNSTKEWDENSVTLPLGEEIIPEDGIIIELTPDADTADPNDYTGTVNSPIILLAEGMEIPENAELILDDNGIVIGYTTSTTTEEITGSTVTEGDANPDEANSLADSDADTVNVAPNLELAQQELGITINDDSVITEELDTDGSIAAYVITNTTESTQTIDAFDALVKPENTTSTDENGNIQTLTSVDILDKAGNVIGFETRKVIMDADGKLLSDTTTTQTVVKHNLPEASDPVTTYLLPEKPTESTVTDETGSTTTVTVTEILDDYGQVIGYKSTTLQLDSSGAELFRGEENIYGTEQTVSEAVSSENETATGTATVYTKPLKPAVSLRSRISTTM